MKQYSVIFFVLLPGIFFLACSRSLAPAGGGGNPSSKGSMAGVPGPKCVVYKTKSDYLRNVPVALSSDKKSIVSFPDVKDVFTNGELAYPSPLESGYLLDNRGIGPDVAFLSYSYEEYSKLPETPSASVLMQHILDPDPLTEMYDCGLRGNFEDPVSELNSLIKSGNLKDKTRLK